MACIYGDITKIDTTGASEETAKEIKRNEKEIIKGVKASSKLAEHDLKDMDQYKDIIFKVARAKQMDPAVIAGIISRESRAGTLLVDGWGDKGKGNGYGLMQVDKTRHKELKKDWKSEQHITQGTEILIGFIKEIQKKFPSWSKEQQFKGGISAYNGGPGNVRTYERMDIGSPGDDYGNDVVARAQWFKRHGYFIDH